MLYNNDSAAAVYAMERMRLGDYGGERDDFWDAPQSDDEYDEDEERPRRFVIDDDQKAAWAVRRIQERVRECEHDIRWYKDKIRQCEEHIVNDTAYLKKLLKDYFDTVPKRETKTRLVYDMPGGRLMLRKARLDYGYNRDAPERLINELKDKGIDCVRVRESVDWKSLKAALTCVDGDVYAITEDGEMIKLDNVSLEEKQEEFLVQGD